MARGCRYRVSAGDRWLQGHAHLPDRDAGQRRGRVRFRHRRRYDRHRQDRGGGGPGPQHRPGRPRQPSRLQLRQARHRPAGADRLREPPGRRPAQAPRARPAAVRAGGREPPDRHLLAAIAAAPGHAAVPAGVAGRQLRGSRRAYPQGLRDRPERGVPCRAWRRTRLRPFRRAFAAEPGQRAEASGRRAPCAPAGDHAGRPGRAAGQRRGGPAPWLDRGVAARILRPDVRLSA